MAPPDFPLDRGARLRDGDRLGVWAGELAADDAARARSRTHWLARQAAEEGTFAGALADLAERARPVVLVLRNGRTHQGVLTAIGADFCALRTPSGREVLVRTDALAAVRTAPGEAITVGDRTLVHDLRFVDALARLAEHRASMWVGSHGIAEPLRGELRAAGRDLLVLRLEGTGATAYVALESVAEISLTESG